MSHVCYTPPEKIDYYYQGDISHSTWMTGKEQKVKVADGKNTQIKRIVGSFKKRKKEMMMMNRDDKKFSLC